jgi:hypothetical protein
MTYFTNKLANSAPVISADMYSNNCLFTMFCNQETQSYSGIKVGHGDFAKQVNAYCNSHKGGQMQSWEQ